MEVERLSVQAMKVRKKMFSKGHEDFIAAVEMVASTYRSQGRWEAAEELEIQVMETFKKILGRIILLVCKGNGMGAGTQCNR